VVVIGVAAAVLLAVGGVAATRAGAEETPQWPDVPGFSLSDLPGFSGFGDDSDARDDSDSGGGSDSGAGSGLADGDSGAGADNGDSGDSADFDGDSGAGADSGNAADSGAGADSGNAATSGDSAGGASDRHEAPSAHRAPVRRDRSGAEGGVDPSGHQRSGVVPLGAAHAVPEKPAPQRAAAVPVKQRPAFVRQDAGGSLVAAAKQNVTASDISSSPSAPTQQEILALINGNRRQHGCGAVSLDRRLIEAANGHAADMARHDYFAHESRNGKGAGDRVTAAGYDWKHYGENIARGVDSPYAVVDGWMHSPEHRHNILDCSLDQMGVGIAIAGDQDRTVYWVQDFATPM
jgi:uncharacterized protein YkwD